MTGDSHGFSSAVWSELKTLQKNYIHVALVARASFPQTPKNMITNSHFYEVLYKKLRQLKSNTMTRQVFFNILHLQPLGLAHFKND